MFRLLETLLGPIFAREVVEVARRRRYYWNRVVYGLGLLGVVLLVGEQYRQKVAVEGKNTIVIMAATGENLFHTLTNLQYAAVFLFVPIFVCGVIAGERQERTLDALLTTSLHDHWLVLGKLSSRLVALLLLILAGAPLLAFLPLFGGVTPEALGRVTAATLLAMLYVAATAVYCSATTDSTFGALVRTYWWLAFWLLAIPVAVLIPVKAHQLGPADPLGRNLLAVGFLINPLGPCVAANDESAYQYLLAHGGAEFFPLGFVVPILWSCFLIVWAGKKVRQTPVSLAPRISTIPLIRAARDHLRRDIDMLMEPLGDHIDLEEFRIRNPLWRRSRLARVYDRAGFVGLVQWAAWLAVAVYIFLLILYDRRAELDFQSTLMFLAPLWVSVFVLTAALGATSLVGDRRRGLLDLILMTRLEPLEILDGTLFALWEHLRRSFALVWLMAFYFCLADRPGLIESLCSVTTATLCCLLLAQYAVLFSLLARTTTRALMATALFAVLANVGMLVDVPQMRGTTEWILLPLSGAALLAGWIAVRSRTTLWTAGCFLVALHWCLIELATLAGWIAVLPKTGCPLLPIYSARMIVFPLRGPAWQTLADYPLWPWIYLCYWGVLGVNYWWVRNWSAAHFDALASRGAGSQCRAPAKAKVAACKV